MPEEQVAPQGEQAAPEPEKPVARVVETTKTVVDTAGFDVAIEALESQRQYIPEGELQALDSRISEIRQQKSEASQSAVAEELAAYRRKEADSTIESMGIDPSTVRGDTAAERLTNAEMIAEAMKPIQEQLADVKKAQETDAPTQEQVAAHGTPMVPGGDVPGGHDSAVNIQEGVNAGNMRQVIDDPLVKHKIEEAAKAALGRKG